MSGEITYIATLWCPQYHSDVWISTADHDGARRLVVEYDAATYRGPSLPSATAHLSYFKGCDRRCFVFSTSIPSDIDYLEIVDTWLLLPTRGVYPRWEMAIATILLTAICLS
jgi:hypothetical protein